MTVGTTTHPATTSATGEKTDDGTLKRKTKHRPGSTNPAREGETRKPKLYGISEYLMVMHEVQKARLADQARKARAEPGGRQGVIRHDGIVPKVKACFGLEARDEAESKGATQWAKD